MFALRQEHGHPKGKIMNKIIVLCTCASILACACNTDNNDTAYDVTLSSLLDEMVDREKLTSYPAIEYKAGQVSSYDRRTVSKDEPGWWANDDGAGYERLDTIAGRYEKVMCDLNGAGVVTRIWMTTKEKYGTMRIYLDGAKNPQIIIPAYDMKRFPLDVPDGLSLTHTHYQREMGGVGGNSFFLPIPFANSCKITFEEPDITKKIPRYYHIGYRLYPQGTSVKTFTIKEAKSLLDKMVAVSNELLNPSEESGIPSIVEGTIKPAKSLTLNISGDNQKMSKLIIKTSDPEDFMITANFDGVRTVSAPLAHFAGAGIGAPKVDGWWLKKDADSIIVRFPMPFRKTAEISLVNISAKDVEASILAETNDCKWSERTLYFHTSFRSEDAIPVSPDYDSDDNLDWNFMTITGRGVYVGDLLSLNNHAIDWYGEGDEKIYVDGEKFPSFMGTGTEDYYNCSWAPVIPFLTPYGGAPRADEESSHGLNAFLRTRNLDNIPFAKSLTFDIEMLSWHHGTVDYNATSFWYGDLNSVTNATL